MSLGLFVAPHEALFGTVCMDVIILHPYGGPITGVARAVRLAFALAPESKDPHNDAKTPGCARDSAKPRAGQKDGPRLADRVGGAGGTPRFPRAAESWPGSDFVQAVLGAAPRAVAIIILVG